MIKKTLNWGVLGFVFLLPWQARHIFNLTPGTELLFNFYALYALDILFFVLAIVWGGWVIKSRKEVFPKLSKFERLSLLVSAVFLSITYVQVQLAPYTEITMYKWDRLLQAWLLLMMIITLKVSLKKILLSLVAAGLVQSCLATAQFFSQAIPANKYLGVAQQLPETAGSSVIDYAGGRWLRGYGSLSHPNILGGFLVICSLIVSHFYIQSYLAIAAFHKNFSAVSDAMKKLFAMNTLGSFLAFGVLVVGLLMTFSRAAWLGFAFGWAVLVLAHLLNARSKRVDLGYILVAAGKQVVVGALILVTLSLSYAPFWTNRLFGGSDFTQTSTSMRAVYLDQAQMLISEQPVLGHGMGQYLFKAEAAFPYETLYDVQPVHNSWLFMWAELGLNGVGVFFLWLYMLFYFLKAILLKSTSEKELLIFALLSGIGLMYYFDHFWWSTYFGVMLIAVIEICILLTISTKKAL